METDETFHSMLIFSISNNLESINFDVETAFLNIDLEEEIFMDCPEAMKHEPHERLFLVKTMYGSSPIHYFNKFKKILVENMGFRNCTRDPCLMIKDPKLIALFPRMLMKIIPFGPISCFNGSSMKYQSMV